MSFLAFYEMSRAFCVNFNFLNFVFCLNFLLCIFGNAIRSLESFLITATFLSVSFVLSLPFPVVYVCLFYCFIFVLFCFVCFVFVLFFILWGTCFFFSVLLQDVSTHFLDRLFQMLEVQVNFVGSSILTHELF